VAGPHSASVPRGGKSYETTELIVFHVQDGRACEAWRHPLNEYGLDEVFG
jgi:ketosteroid isomerase-like protein